MSEAHRERFPDNGARRLRERPQRRRPRRTGALRIAALGSAGPTTSCARSSGRASWGFRGTGRWRSTRAAGREQIARRVQAVFAAHGVALVVTLNLDLLRIEDGEVLDETALRYAEAGFSPAELASLRAGAPPELAAAAEWCLLAPRVRAEEIAEVGRARVRRRRGRASGCRSSAATRRDALDVVVAAARSRDRGRRRAGAGSRPGTRVTRS